jgi:hypothetical protein
MSDSQPTDFVERIVTEADVRLFRLSTVLAVLPQTVFVSYLNPVEIRSGRRRLGWASLHVEKARGAQTIKADMVFDYASPERLTIETGGAKLFARLEGVHEMLDEPFESVGLYHVKLRPAQILQIDVLGLEISDKPSYDDQPYLGEAVL